MWQWHKDRQVDQQNGPEDPAINQHSFRTLKDGRETIVGTRQIASLRNGARKIGNLYSEETKSASLYYIERLIHNVLSHLVKTLNFETDEENIDEIVQNVAISKGF